MRFLLLFFVIVFCVVFGIHHMHKIRSKTEGFEVVPFDQVMEDLYCDSNSCPDGNVQNVEYDPLTGKVTNISCPSETCHVLEPVANGTAGWEYVTQDVPTTRDEEGNCSTNHEQLSEYSTPMMCDGSSAPVCGLLKNQDTCEDVDYFKRFAQNGQCVWQKEVSSRGTSVLTNANTEYNDCLIRESTPPASVLAPALLACPSGTVLNSESDSCSPIRNCPDTVGGQKSCVHTHQGIHHIVNTTVQQTKAYENCVYRVTSPGTLSGATLSSCSASCPPGYVSNSDGTRCQYPTGEPSGALAPASVLATLTPAPAPLVCPSGTVLNSESDSCSPIRNCPDTVGGQKSCVHTHQGIHHIVNTTVQQTKAYENCVYRVTSPGTLSGATLSSCSASCPPGYVSNSDGTRCQYPTCNETVSYTVNGSTVDEDVWNNWESSYRSNDDYCGGEPVNKSIVMTSTPCTSSEGNVISQRSRSAQKSSALCPIPECAGVWSSPADLDQQCGTISYVSSFTQTPGTDVCTPSEDYANKTVTVTKTEACELCSADTVSYSHGLTEAEFDNVNENSPGCDKDLIKTTIRNPNAHCITSDGNIVNTSTEEREDKRVACYVPCYGTHDSTTACYDRDMEEVTCGSGYNTRIFNRSGGGEDDCDAPLQNNIPCERVSGCSPCERTVSFSTPDNMNLTTFTDEDYAIVDTNSEYCNVRIIRSSTANSPCKNEGGSLIHAGDRDSEEKLGPPCLPNIETTVSDYFIEIKYIKDRFDYELEVSVYKTTDDESVLLQNDLSYIEDVSEYRLYRYVPSSIAEHIINIKWKRSVHDAWETQIVTKTVSDEMLLQKLRSVECARRASYSYDPEGAVPQSISNTEWDSLDTAIVADDPNKCGKMVYRKNYVIAPFPCMISDTGNMSFESQTINIETKNARACRQNCVTSNVEVVPCRDACGLSTRTIKKTLVTQPSVDGTPCPSDTGSNIEESCISYANCSACGEYEFELILPNGSNVNVRDYPQLTDVNWVTQDATRGDHMSQSQDLKNEKDLCGKTVDLKEFRTTHCYQSGVVQPPYSKTRSNQELSECHPECTYAAPTYTYSDGKIVPKDISNIEWDSLESSEHPYVCDKTILRTKQPEVTPCYDSTLQTHITPASDLVSSKTGGPCSSTSICEPDIYSIKYYIPAKTEFAPANIESLLKKTILKKTDKNTIYSYMGGGNRIYYDVMNRFITNPCIPDTSRAVCADDRPSYIEGLDGYIDCDTPRDSKKY